MFFPGECKPKCRPLQMSTRDTDGEKGAGVYRHAPVLTTTLHLRLPSWPFLTPLLPASVHLLPFVSQARHTTRGGDKMKTPNSTRRKIKPIHRRIQHSHVSVSKTKYEEKDKKCRINMGPNHPCCDVVIQRWCKRSPPSPSLPSPPLPSVVHQHHRHSLESQ